MRFLYLFLFSCWLTVGWAQLEAEDFDDIEIQPPLEEDYEYEEVEAIFNLEAVQKEPLPDRQFDKNKWEDLRQQNDYSQENKPKEPKKKEEEQAAEPWALEGIGNLLTIVLYAMLIIVVALLLYFLLRPTPKNRKLAKAKTLRNINLENIEENLDRADVDAFIAEAEAAGNYQQAVRLHFLASLKALSTKGYLKWKKDKTNRTYLRELRQADAYAEFKRLTLIFENVWYGHQAPDADHYDRLRTDFVAFRQSITPLSPSYVEQ